MGGNEMTLNRYLDQEIESTHRRRIALLLLVIILKSELLYSIWALKWDGMAYIQLRAINWYHQQQYTLRNYWKILFTDLLNDLFFVVYYLREYNYCRCVSLFFSPYKDAKISDFLSRKSEKSEICCHKRRQKRFFAL